MSAQNPTLKQRLKDLASGLCGHFKTQIFTKKFGIVVAAFVLTFVSVYIVAVTFAGADEELLVVGLVVAGFGQLAESAGKASELQNNATAKDGLELYGEGMKFLGSLVAITGAILALNS